MGIVTFGNINRHGYSTPQYDFSSNFYKIFLQPAINITPGGGNIFKVGGGFRVTMVDYYGYSAVSDSTKYLITKTEPHYRRVRTDPSTAPFLYYEPFINLEVGYKVVKFNMQTGASIPVSESTGDLGYGPFMSFGLVFHYAPIYFK